MLSDVIPRVRALYKTLHYYYYYIKIIYSKYTIEAKSTKLVADMP